MDAALIRWIWQRAGNCCEYCRLPQAHSSPTFEIDHIISRKHGGRSIASNLALSCFYCNSFKGSDIAGRDRRTRRLVPLFHPRRHRWAYHFRWNGPVLEGRTPIGRVTVALLNINEPEAVEVRRALIEAGLFPPA